MEYKFQNIIGHLGNGCDMEYGYVLVLDTHMSIINYMLKHLDANVKDAFLNHVNSCYGKYHHSDSMALAASIRADVRGISFAESLSTLTSDKIDSMIAIQNKYGIIYLQKVGSYFPCRDITVLDEIITDKFIFPTKKLLTNNDIRIYRWPNGKHYYASIDGNQLEVDGECKWNTIEYAQELAEEEIKKINKGDTNG